MATTFSTVLFLACYKRYLEGISRYITSFDIIKNNDYKYELVEENEFETKYDLHERERYYIENFDCVNKVIPNRTDKEYHKEYRKNNQEYLKEYRKKYYKENKEKKREYYETNKEKFAEKNKEKVSCECGAIVSRDALTRHKKRKIHLDKII